MRDGGEARPLPSDRHLADLALARAAHGGDEAALRRLVTGHQQALFNLALRMTGDRMDAEDLTQEAFIRALQSLGEYRGDAALSTWLHRVAVRCALDWLRTRRRWSAGAGRLRALAGEPEPSAEREVIRREGQEAVQTAVLSLPPHYRAAVALFYFQGLSARDAAAALDLPVRTLETRLSRARAILRQRLGPRPLGGDRPDEEDSCKPVAHPTQA